MYQVLPNDGVVVANKCELFRFRFEFGSGRNDVQNLSIEMEL